MASTIRYFVSGTGSDLLDLRDPLSQYSLTGQSIVATGSGLVNTVYAAPGVDLDARGLLGGSDVVFFSYNWSQYTKSTSEVAGAITFTATVNGKTERVVVSNGATPLGRDTLVFADGSVGTQQANTTLGSNAGAAITAVSGYNAGLTTSAPGAALPTTFNATLTAFGSTTDANGAVFASPTVGVRQVLTGTGQTDKVYVKAGATVDARNLLGGEDQIFFNGSWAEYAKSLTANSGSITFTRTVNGMSESVVVSNGAATLGRDKLIFADGSVLTHNVRTALTTDLNAAITAVTGYEAATVTPGVTLPGAPEFSVSTGSTLGGSSVISGTADAGATVNITIDPDNNTGTANSFSYTAKADAAGNFSLNLGNAVPTSGASSFVPGTASVSATQTNTGGVTGAATVHTYTSSVASYFGVSGPTASVNEDAGTVTFTVVRTGSTANAATVSYNTVDGSAIAGTGGDYTATVGTLTFAPGQTTATVTVAINDDTLLEGTESFTLALSNPTGGAQLLAAGTSTATATILDNDQSNWSVVASAPTYSESAGVITYTVSRTGATPAATIRLATTGGTATGDLDYTSLDQTLTFDAGQTTRTVTVAINDDSLSEPNETVVTTLSNASAGIISVGTAAVTIIDNDQSTWSITGPGTVDEGAGTMSFVVSRTGMAAAATIQFATGGGTALAGSDYTAVNAQTLSFAANEYSKTVTVAITNDTLAETLETVGAVISNASTGSIAVATASGSILDNDSVTYSIAANGNVYENAGPLTYTVTRTGDTSISGSVGWVVWGYDVGNAAAELGATSGTVNFTAGQVTGTVSIPIIDNGTPQGDRTVSVRLVNPMAGGSAASLSASPQAVEKILDDDQVRFSITGDNTATEGGVLTYTVTRTGATTSAASVAWNMVGGTASVADFSGATGGVLSFAANETVKVISLTTVADSLGEGPETATVALSNALLNGSSTGTNIVTSAASGTIVDMSRMDFTLYAGANDSTFPTALGSGIEGGPMLFTIVRTGNSTAAATVSWEAITGSATAADFSSPISGMVTFAAGQTVATFELAPLVDGLVEGTETIRVRLNGATSSNPSIMTQAASLSPYVNIVDGDQVVYSVVAPAAVAEGGDAIFTVNRTGNLGVAGTVAWSVVGGGVTAADFAGGQALSGTLSFGANEGSKTFTLKTLIDGVAEADTIVVRLDQATAIGSAATIGTSMATASLTDDKLVVFTGEAGNGGGVVSEGGGFLTYVVTRSGNTSVAATVDWTLGMLQTTAADFAFGTAFSGTLSFGIGETSKSLAFPIFNDTLPEINEIARLNLSNPVAAGASAQLANVNTDGIIADDDSSSYDVVKVTDIVEGGKAVFNIVRSGDLSVAGSVGWSLVGGTAPTASIGGADLPAGTATNGVVNFEIGQSVKTIEIQTLDDNLPEQTEWLRVALSNPLNGGKASSVSGSVPAVAVFDNDSVRYGIANYGDSLESTGGSRYVVYRSGDLSVAGTVNWSVYAYLSDPGNNDLGPVVSGTVSFAAGESNKTITVPIVDNNTPQANHTLYVKLYEPTAVGRAASIEVAETYNLPVDDDQVRFGVSAGAAVNEGGQLVYTVTRSASGAALQSSSTVDWSWTGGSSVAADFIGATSGTVSFAAGETTRTFVLTTAADSLVEGGESAIVRLSNAVTTSGTAGVNISTPTASGTILDNGVTGYSISLATNSQEGGMESFVITRTGNINAAGSVQWSVLGGTAVGSDLTGALTGTVSFDAGVNTRTISIRTVDNAIGQAERTIVVGLHDAVSNTPGFAASVIASTSVGTIYDNDQVRFAASGLTHGSEGGGAVTYYVTRSGNLQAAATVDWAIGGNDVGASRFSGATSGTLSFAAGETGKTVVLTPIDDSVSQLAVASVVLGLSNAQTTTAGAVATLSNTVSALNLYDNDEVQFAIAGGGGVGELGAGMYVVTRSGNLTGAATVDWAFTGGGFNTYGSTQSDYVGPYSGTLTFAAGEYTKVIRLAAFNDNLVESPNEQGLVVLSNAQWGGAPTHITTLAGAAYAYDNDTSRYSISAASAEEGKGLVYTVTRENSQNAMTPGSVAWVLNGGTATVSDFSGPTAGILSFAAGEFVKTFVIDTVVDADTANETATVTLYAPSGSVEGRLTTPTATATIVNPYSAYAIASVGDSMESLGTLAYLVTRSGALDSVGTVSWSVTGGTATSGSDYIATAGGTLTFAAGEATRLIKIATVDDSVTEANETVVVTLASPTSGSGVPVLAVASASGTILDEERTDYGIVLSLNGHENAGAVGFNVTRAGALSAGTVNWSLTGGSATAADFSGATSGVLTFAAGEQTKFVRLAVLNDSFAEGDETAVVTLSAATGAGATIQTPSATATIFDDDQGRFLISNHFAALTEDAGSAMVYVQRDRGFDTAASVTWTLTGTATAGSDYTGPTTGVLSFAPGETIKGIVVPIVNDGAVEGNETLIFTLSSATNGATILAASTTYTIQDDDALVGTAGADTFTYGTNGAANTGAFISAGAGNDTIVLGNANLGAGLQYGDGYGLVDGGADHDTFVYSGQNPLSGLLVVKGGAGVDTVQFSGAGASLNLAAVPAAVLQGMEKIDLTGTGNNTLALNINDLLNVTRDFSTNAVGKTLMVTGNAGDAVNLSGWGLGTSLGLGTTIDVFNGTTATTASVVSDSNGNGRSEVVVGGVNYDVYTSALDIAVHLLVSTSLTTALV